MRERQADIDSTETVRELEREASGNGYYNRPESQQCKPGSPFIRRLPRILCIQPIQS